MDMLGDMFYDRQGNKISVDKFEKLFMDPRYKVLRKTQIGDVEVSTVWLGLNHSFSSGLPLIFETMVFGGSDSENGEMRRYPTEEDAIVGHRRMVNNLLMRRSPDAVAYDVTEERIAKYEGKV